MKRTLFLCVMLLCTQFVLSQQKQKYEGRMIIPKDVPSVDLKNSYFIPGETQGNVLYEYYTNSKGERIRDGKFIFEYICGRGGYFKCYVYGSYKNGKMHGQWLYTMGEGLYLGANGTMVSNKNNSSPYYALLTYQNGVKTGPFEAYINEYSLYNYRIKGELENNHFVNDLQVEKESLVKLAILNAKYNKDGLPHGTWKIKRLSDISVEQTRIYDNGIVKEIFDIDLSTGEKTIIKASKGTPTSNNPEDYKKVTINGNTYYQSLSDFKYYIMASYNPNVTIDDRGFTNDLNFFNGLYQTIRTLQIESDITKSFTKMIESNDKYIADLAAENKKKEIKQEKDSFIKKTALSYSNWLQTKQLCSTIEEKANSLLLYKAPVTDEKDIIGQTVVNEIKIYLEITNIIGNIKKVNGAVSYLNDFIKDGAFNEELYSTTIHNANDDVYKEYKNNLKTIESATKLTNIGIKEWQECITTMEDIANKLSTHYPKLKKKHKKQMTTYIESEDIDGLINYILTLE